jgi:hypothetical protein
MSLVADLRGIRSHDFRDFRYAPEYPCCRVLVRRDLGQPLKLRTGQIIQERRQEYVVAEWTGLHFLGQEPHWSQYATIPPLNHWLWQDAALFAPPAGRPLLGYLPFALSCGGLAVAPGLHFVISLGAQVWRVHCRTPIARGVGAEDNWVSVSHGKVWRWLMLPRMNIRLRSQRYRAACR